jgi:predicted ArsR family transcriptional regulator
MKPQDSARARDKVLFYLKTKGPQTAAQLARRLAVTPMAVRQHLYALEQDSMVSFTDERKRVGRPSRIWRLTSKAGAMFPDNHSELAVGIIDAVKQAFGEKGLSRLVSERTRLQLQRYRESISAHLPLEKKVAALAAIRREEGYMAEWSQDAGGALTLTENNCPICAAASACNGLCEGELELFRQLLGDDVEVERSEHILAGARRCLYRIRAAQASIA